jgi:hypothetical protein
VLASLEAPRFAADVKRPREREAEDAKLKRMNARLALKNVAINQVLNPKVVTSSWRRHVVEALVEQRISEQRACRVVRLSRTAFYQPPMPAGRSSQRWGTSGRSSTRRPF